MGLTERHWFENEEPELTDQQLEDIVYENEKAYNSGYVKGFHDAKTEYQEIQDMLSNAQKQNADKHGCKTGKRKEGWDEAFQVMKSLLHNYAHKQ